VVEVIKKLKDTEGVTVSTQNTKGDINFYGNNVGTTKAVVGTPTKAFPSGASYEAKATTEGINFVGTDSLKAISNKNDPLHYITPSAKFRGTVHRNGDTNSIDWIEFTQE
jgi:hypothetical protein